MSRLSCPSWSAPLCTAAGGPSAPTLSTPGSAESDDAIDLPEEVVEKFLQEFGHALEQDDDGNLIIPEDLFLQYFKEYVDDTDGTETSAEAEADSSAFGIAGDIVVPVPSGDMLASLLEILDQNKVLDVQVLDVASKTMLTDYFVVGTGRSHRHMRNVCHEVASHFKDVGVRIDNQPPAVEGSDEDAWMCVDAGNVIFHIFEPDMRREVDLETLWSSRGSLADDQKIELSTVHSAEDDAPASP